MRLCMCACVLCVCVWGGGGVLGIEATRNEALPCCRTEKKGKESPGNQYIPGYSYPGGGRSRDS